MLGIAYLSYISIFSIFSLTLLFHENDKILCKFVHIFRFL